MVCVQTAAYNKCGYFNGQSKIRQPVCNIVFTLGLLKKKIQNSKMYY